MAVGMLNIPAGLASELQKLECTTVFGPLFGVSGKSYNCHSSRDYHGLVHGCVTVSCLRRCKTVQRKRMRVQRKRGRKDLLVAWNR
jgi:hypothetical protein